MSEEAETIGSLIFVPDPEYPYPFKVERPPRFWMEETTGTLAAVIEIYMRSEALKADQLDLIRLYLKQYLERAVITDEADRRRMLGRIDKLRNVQDVERLVDDLAEVGVEPF